MENLQFGAICSIPSDVEPELKLVEVFVAPIDRKCASSVIAELNRLHPVPSLRHLKRIRSVEKTEGPCLEIIVCLAEHSENTLSLHPVLEEFVKGHELKPFITKV